MAGLLTVVMLAGLLPTAEDAYQFLLENGLIEEDIQRIKETYFPEGETLTDAQRESLNSLKTQLAATVTIKGP